MNAAQANQAYVINSESTLNNPQPPLLPNQPPLYTPRPDDYCTKNTNSFSSGIVSGFEEVAICCLTCCYHKIHPQNHPASRAADVDSCFWKMGCCTGEVVACFICCPMSPLCCICSCGTSADFFMDHVTNYYEYHSMSEKALENVSQDRYPVES